MIARPRTHLNEEFIVTGDDASDVIHHSIIRIAHLLIVPRWYHPPRHLVIWSFGRTLVVYWALHIGKSMSATEFEKHAGMGQAKKWKAWGSISPAP